MWNVIFYTGSERGVIIIPLNVAFFKPFSLFDVGNAFQAAFHREVAHRGLLYCVVPPSLYEGYSPLISSGVR